MTGTIDRATLDRLIALGRARGELTAAEFQAALPVDELDVDTLVLVMLELEAAGISVEPDALGPRAETSPAPKLILASPEPGVPRPSVPAPRGREPAAQVGPPRMEKDEAGDGEEPEGSVGRVVLVAGLVVVLVLGTILLLT